MRYFLLFLTSFFLFVCCNQDAEQRNSNASPMDVKEMEVQAIKDSLPQENPYKNSNIEVKTFSNSAGKDSADWGYDIFIDKNQYVHQPHIPAVSGNRGFSNEEKAKKAGEFVAYKIRNNIMPPSVSPEELDSLGVLN